MSAPSSSAHHPNQIPFLLGKMHIHLTSNKKILLYLPLDRNDRIHRNILRSGRVHLKRIEGFHHYWFLALFELVVFSVMTFVWMMITMDNVENGDVKDFGSNTNGVEDVFEKYDYDYS